MAELPKSVRDAMARAMFDLMNNSDVVTSDQLADAALTALLGACESVREEFGIKHCWRAPFARDPGLREPDKFFRDANTADDLPELLASYTTTYRVARPIRRLVITTAAEDITEEMHGKLAAFGEQVSRG